MKRSLLSLSNLKKDIKWPGILSPVQPLLNNVDSTRVDGKRNIPVYLRETSSDIYYRKDPKDRKEIVRAEKTIRIDEYIDNKGLTSNIRYLYQDIDIYDNEIFFLSNKFLSPVASTAPLFYRFYIIDTSYIGNPVISRCFSNPGIRPIFCFTGSFSSPTTQHTPSGK